MRTALLGLGHVVLVACTSPKISTPPSNTTSPAAIPGDLGSLVLVTATQRTDALPAFVPTGSPFPIVDPTRRMPPNTPMRVTDAHGTSDTFTSGEPTKIAYGCDNNQLEVTPLAGSTQLAPGVAWALHDAVLRPTAQRPIIGALPAQATYTFGDLIVRVERDATKKDRGLMRVLVAGREVAAAGFARTLMDGAEPALATLDLREGGPAIPVPLAAWSIDGSGHAPFLVAIERPSWEGTSLEAWLVEAASARQIESMTAYLYQCAF